jgi:hypothetical protein
MGAGLTPYCFNARLQDPTVPRRKTRGRSDVSAIPASRRNCTWNLDDPRVGIELLPASNSGRPNRIGNRQRFSWGQVNCVGWRLNEYA